MTPIRIVSYGGGVQSTALAVLATQNKIGHVDAAVFANTGDDSEMVGTIEFVRETMTPWAADRGLPIIEVAREPWPSGDAKTLLSYVKAYNGCQACGVGPEDDCHQLCPSTRNTGGDIPIPLELLPSLAPVQRSCTNHWKIIPIRRWLLAAGASGDNPADVLIGISTDEMERATDKPRHKAERAVYPLLELGLSRSDCRDIIIAAGLPVPPKSTCWFCPFHGEQSWRERRVNDPGMYAAAVAIEDGLNEQRRRRSTHRPGDFQPVQFLSSRPLREVRDPDPTLFDPSSFNEGGCDEGYCWT